MAKHKKNVVQFPVHRTSHGTSGVHSVVPPDLRERLEATRLQSLALFRALDRIYVSLDQLPQRPLKHLFELDADCAEALWALDQPHGKLNEAAMVRDTIAALERIPKARHEFYGALSTEELSQLHEVLPVAHHFVEPDEAYNGVPGRDPAAERPRD